MLITNTDKLIQLINDTPVTIENRLKYEEVIAHPKDFNYTDLGFATFFINRTSRSGILKGGVIGGRKQLSKYPLDCRYNKVNLCKTISKIGKRAADIEVTNLDALKFLAKASGKLNEPSLLYLDPPYYMKGQQLYTNFYTDSDHRKLAKYIQTNIRTPWIVSYDNAPAILEMYSFAVNKQQVISYTAATKRQEKEVMFFSPMLSV